MTTSIGETVFDRVGTKLIRCAADLWDVSQQVAISDEVARDVVQSQKEIEASNTEAIKQIEQRAIEIEQAIIGQVNALRALKEGQAAQVENRQMIEAMGGHLAETNLPHIQDEVATIATILGHGNYMHLIKGEVLLWKWLIRVVDPLVFADAFGQQESEWQHTLFASLRKAPNSLKKVDGILEEPE